MYEKLKLESLGKWGCTAHYKIKRELCKEYILGGKILSPIVSMKL